MGLISPMPTLGNPCRSHAHRRRPNIHRGDSSTEGCQRRQVMEPDPWLSLRGYDLGWLVARPCGASSAKSPWCSRRCVFKGGWSSAGNLPTVWSE